VTTNTPQPPDLTPADLIRLWTLLKSGHSLDQALAVAAGTGAELTVNRT
jgi:hypothetical protein